MSNGSPTIQQLDERATLFLARQIDIRKFTIEAAKRLAERLNEEIEQGHETTAFLIALFLAAAKDGLDLYLDVQLVGLVPVLGQIPGLFLSAALFFFLWGKGWFLRGRIKIGWRIAGLFFDTLPVFNALPINILMVLYAWHNIRGRANRAEENLGKLHKLGQKEIEALDRDTTVLGEAV